MSYIIPRELPQQALPNSPSLILPPIRTALPLMPLDIQLFISTMVTSAERYSLLRTCPSNGSICCRVANTKTAVLPMPDLAWHNTSMPRIACGMHSCCTERAREEVVTQGRGGVKQPPRQVGEPRINGMNPQRSASEPLSSTLSLEIVYTPIHKANCTLRKLAVLFSCQQPRF